MEPLSPIAPANRFFDNGDAICAETDMDPADSPGSLPLWITPESRDILVHPFESRVLIQQAVITGRMLARFFRQVPGWAKKPKMPSR